MNGYQVMRPDVLVTLKSTQGQTYGQILETIAARRHTTHLCLSCGAPVQPIEKACSYCKTVP